MLALCLAVLGSFGDPVTAVQVRHPARRTTVTSASGSVVFYTLAPDAPPELRRAYKLLEVAEREVLIADGLQLLRLEVVQNERRLESLRTERSAAYLAQTGPGPQLLWADPALAALPESNLKWALGGGLARDARVERAVAAVDRLAGAHYELRQALVALAYPDAAARPVVRRVGRAAAPAPVAVRVPAPAVDARRAEQVAAAEEVRAEERERLARERSADAADRAAAPADRPAAREAWVRARGEWEQARREWDAAREAWQAARDRAEAAPRR